MNFEFGSGNSQADLNGFMSVKIEVQFRAIARFSHWGYPVRRVTNKRVRQVAVQKALCQLESLLFCTAMNH